MTTASPAARGAPQITVLMPMYNGERYVGAAIESILGQTFDDFELLVMDDGSDDSSPSIVRDYAARDRRIRIVSRENRGLVATLNEGLERARGTYLARMDCDDLSVPERLQTQLDFMRAHPDYALCGSNAHIINRRGRLLAYWSVPVEDAQSFRVFSYFSAPFAHSSAFIRLACLRAGDFCYSENYPHVEDFELWGRISRRHSCAVLDEKLVMWRNHDAGICNRLANKQMDEIARIVDRNVTDDWLKLPAGVYARLLTRAVAPGDIVRAAEASGRLIETFENLAPRMRVAAQFSFRIFLNRMIVEIAHRSGLASARDFFGRLPGKAPGPRSHLLMAMPRWVPDALAYRIEATAAFAYQRVLPLWRAPARHQGSRL